MNPTIVFKRNRRLIGGVPSSYEREIKFKNRGGVRLLANMAGNILIETKVPPHPKKKGRTDFIFVSREAAAIVAAIVMAELDAYDRETLEAQIDISKLNIP